LFNGPAGLRSDAGIGTVATVMPYASIQAGKGKHELVSNSGLMIRRASTRARIVRGTYHGGPTTTESRCAARTDYF
jgi:hypothetical protein